LTNLLATLGIELVAGLPVAQDAVADATTTDGGVSTEISADLDITSWFAGWARLSGDLFVGEGPLSCDREEVQCTNDPLPPSDETAIVVAIRVRDVIRLGDPAREASFGVALSRPGFEDSPSDRGGYSDADLVFIAGLNAGEFSAIEWESEGWHFAPRRGGEARVVVAGDTIVFVLPNDRSERPNGRVVGFERIPPSDISGNADAIDVAVDLESFFGIEYRLNFGN
jgi:hypothetical protein